MYSIDAVPDPLGEGPIIVNAFCNFCHHLGELHSPESGSFAAVDAGAGELIFTLK